MIVRVKKKKTVKNIGNESHSMKNTACKSRGKISCSIVITDPLDHKPSLHRVNNSNPFPEDRYSARCWKVEN